MTDLTHSRDRRIAIAVVAAVALAGVVGGMLAGVPTDVPPVLAYACKSPNAECAPGVYHRTAAVDVTHGVPGASVTPVEPDDGETWDITAYWNSANVPCTENSEVAHATVSWTSAGWTLSNVALTDNIVALNICNELTCETVDLHGHGYRLIAEVYDPHRLSGNNLRRVSFSTTSVDDGHVLDTSTCSLGSSVSPTSQTFTANDDGAFECGYDCDYAGTSLLISYE